MHTFKYDVSFRIWHPQKSADEICNKLGLKPRIKHTVGKQRETPKGTPLDGVYERTYCSFKLEHSDGVKLGDFLKDCNNRLYKYKVIFEEIHSSGGTLEYFIGWYSDKNSGEILDLELLSKLVELKIELSLDFYGGPERVRKTGSDHD